MKTKPIPLLISIALLLTGASPALAQGTVFTYQGRLNDSNSPANGSYDLHFSLFDFPDNGNQVSGILQITGVPVTNGLFTTTLDFGSGPFSAGAARWLQIRVRTNGSAGGFTSLVPRQAVTPAPYAIHAGNAALLSGRGTNAFAPATGSPEYVRKAGDTMTGTLNLPLNGLATGIKQLVVAGGNVGIGNPSPTRTLHAGSATDAGASGHVRIAVDSPTENDPGFEWLTSGGLNWSLYRPANSSDLRFYEPTVGDRVTFKANGNVGIGTTSPTSKLHVGGSLNANQYDLEGSRILDHSATVARLANSTDWTDLTIAPGGTERMRVQANGNVGIGTESPENKLHVASGWIQMNRGYGVGADLRTVGGWYRPNLGLALPHTAEYGSLNFIASASGFAPHFAFRNSLDNSAWMVISDGNVGIGTTTPSTSLEVVGNHVSSPIAVFRQSNPANLGSVAIDSPTDNGSRPSHLLFRRGGVDRWSVGGFYPSEFFGIGTSVLLADQKLVVDTDGNVGIGTASPEARLHVAGNVAVSAPNQFIARYQNENNDYSASLGWNSLQLGNNGANYIIAGRTLGSSSLIFVTDNTNDFHQSSTPHNGKEVMALLPNGNVGIGTTDPTARLDVTGTVKATSFTGNGSGLTGVAPSGTAGGDLSGSYPNPTVANNAVTSAKLASDAASLSKVSGGLLTISGGNLGIGTNTPQAKFHVAGDLRTTVLTVTGGADVAEPFLMSEEDIPKGAVVVIDEENPGQLKLSESAYDRRVAGIVSGAGGVQPGITLSQQGVLEGGQQVALSGRVYVQADATHGPIKPGDMLTTSATPGHAMKVSDHAKAQGAILGKAMSRLEEGKGLVLVLVTLQ